MGEMRANGLRCGGGRFRRIAAATALILAAAASGAAAQNPPLQPADVLALEMATDPQISPDGTRIAYVRVSPDIMKDQYFPAVWTADADGANARALTAPEEMAGEPRWSPDGGRLAFAAMREQGPVIVVRDMKTGAETLIAGLMTPASDLAWSPDGSRIAYMMFAPEAPRVIGELPSPPEGAEWKPGPVVIERGYYRADGMGIIPSGAKHLYVAPASGGEPVRITKDDSGYPPFEGGAFAWTPDGRGLVVSLIRKSEREILQGAMYETGLYLFPTDGGESELLIDRPGPEVSPAVSPDGRHVAYVGYEDKGGQIYTNSKLSVLDLETGETRILSKKLDRSVAEPAWSADGKAIYAIYADRGVTKLALFDLDGAMTPVAEGLGMAHTAYYAEPRFTVSDSGVVAMQWSSPYSTGNIARVDAPGAPIDLVTDLNASLLAARSLGRVEEINYRSSKGKLPIQGWLIYPPDFDPAKKYPLILEIHGGPTTDYGARFDIEKQLMAAAGYVVFYPNVRGSTGYGEGFVNLINDDYPNLEFHDLMAGVDAVVARGFVDPERLYVTGGSGGGTLTAWLIANSDRFAAAAVLYPVVDWRSQALTSDIMPVVFNGFFHGTPWSQPQEYERRSLLKTVPKVGTPTLVMTGEADYRTPISESEQYYAALKYHGVESVFVRVPMENHGIRMFPSHFAAKVPIIIGWFEAH